MGDDSGGLGEMTLRPVAQLTIDSFIDNYTGMNFTNEYGERFELVMIDNQVGIMKGDETNWKDIYLVNGFAINFSNWDADELLWLQNHFQLDPKIPGPILTCTKKNGVGYSFLDDDICPMCLRQCKTFELHHVIEACRGGSDTYQNIIRICASCHALETGGEDYYLYSIHNALTNFQMYHFGVDFFLCQRYGNKRYKDRHIKHYDERTYSLIKEICKYWGNTYKTTGKKPDLKAIFDRKDAWTGRSLREQAKLKYHYFRHVFLGTIPFSYIEQNIIDE